MLVDWFVVDLDLTGSILYSESPSRPSIDIKKPEPKPNPNE